MMRGEVDTGTTSVLASPFTFINTTMKKRDCKTELEELYFEIGQGVYCIQNKYTDAVYFGNTNDLRSRYQKHLWYLRRSRHPNGALQVDYNTYGEEAFTFSILHATESPARRHHLERLFISETRSEGLRVYNVKTPTENRYRQKDKKLLEKIVKEAI